MLTEIAETAPQSRALDPITRESLSVAAVVARTRKVQEIMKTLMKKDLHYGVVPGTPKPSLWQPGAELLLLTFQLAADLAVEELTSFDGDEIRYRVKARIRHVPSGEIVAEGVGEASTDEEKYHWRKAVCQEEFDETAEDRRRKKWGRGERGTYTVLQIRTNPKDLANTVLKMAVKRAVVGGARTATGASDIFGQDLEELTELGIELEEQQGEVVRMPQAKQPTAVPAAEPPAQSAQQREPGVDEDVPPSNGEAITTAFPWAKDIPVLAVARAKAGWHDKGVVSEKQVNRLFAIAKKQGWSTDQVDALVREQFGCAPSELPWGEDAYGNVVAIFAVYQPGV